MPELSSQDARVKFQCRSGFSLKEGDEMKTVNVVAAVIQNGNAILRHSMDIANSRTDGSFLAVKSKMAKRLKKHEAAKWLTMDQIDSVNWLPADIKVV